MTTARTELESTSPRDAVGIGCSALVMHLFNMRKLEEFEKWMKAGEPLGAQHDRVTAWAAWSTAWDAAISDAADVFWNHEATRKRISIQDSQTVVKAIESLRHNAADEAQR